MRKDFFLYFLMSQLVSCQLQNITIEKLIEKGKISEMQASYELE